MIGRRRPRRSRAGAARCVDVTSLPRRARASCGPPARETVRPLLRDRPARAVAAGRGPAPRLGRAHARAIVLREAPGSLPDALRRGARRLRLGGRRATPARRLGGRPVGVDALDAPTEASRRCVTSSASGACGGRAPELKRSYDVVIIGGGSHGLATAYYLRQHGHHQRRGARARLHRLRRRGPQHDDPALQLQDARGRALLRRLGQALRAALGAELDFNLLFSPVRPPHARALRPRDVRDGQPRRGQPPARHRLAADLARRDPAARARR